MQSHATYMHQCIQLGEEALTKGNPPVGCILVWEGTPIATGIENGRASGDVTQHAELLAIQEAVAKGHRDKLPQSTLYSTHEPCVMCAYPIRQYKIPTLVYSLGVAELGGHTSPWDLLTTETIPKWGQAPEIISGILTKEVEILNQKFQDLVRAKD
ncbi:MAG: deaminase [Bacteroidota bacterium]